MDKLLRVPSLQALQALVQVAEAGSFTAAARQLHLTQSAISRQVQQLEEYYRVPLFDRTSRKVALNEAGHEVYAVARDMLRELLRLEERLAPAVQDRPFRIRIFVSLAVRWLLPRLSSFYTEHPELCLSIETVGGEVVDDGGDCDAYVLYLPSGSDPQDRALTPLYDEYLIPVCAPRLNDGQEPPRSLDELARHALIHSSTGRLEWPQWLRAQGDPPPTQFKHILFNLDDLALDAATRGMGVAMTDRMLAHDALQRGDLIVPFGAALKTGGRYALWVRDSGAAHPACQAVLDWFELQRNNLDF
ncbi:LysR substrate-binding domain-containing protein [Pseudomonas sp. CAN2814]|uniref:LysR substrate-binding domain-containing protein n=1 Tax=Pseudomonas sp. CAN1 TaxID=3046726 RepID=UPI0026483FF4|nr:LysR substrate-binding domain-containing protein [Pseudomonas sp. CAN1]MDN6858861.1 LysR substrate-binding domain-containing protein [Pseudomonas sp. CAN1]